MAKIMFSEIQKYVDTQRNWMGEGESPATECLVIQLKEDNEDDFVIDEEMVNETLYLQSRNGHVVLEFDKCGLLVSIEVV